MPMLVQSFTPSAGELFDLEASPTMLFRLGIRLPHWQNNLQDMFFSSTKVTTLATYDHTWLLACISGGIFTREQLKQLLNQENLIVTRVYSRKLNGDMSPEERLLQNEALKAGRQKGRKNAAKSVAKNNPEEFKTFLAKRKIAVSDATYDNKSSFFGSRWQKAARLNKVGVTEVETMYCQQCGHAE